MADAFKVLLLAGTAQMFVAAIAPPKRAVEAGNRTGSVYKGQPFEFIVRFLAYLGCILAFASACSHSILLLHRNHTLLLEPLVPWLCPSMPDSLDPLAPFSTRFLVGVALVFCGTAIRISAYHALGTLFTYEVVVKDNHRLVTTGPYQYVRHPSYTGVALLLLGTHLVHFGDGGYVTYCNIDATPMILFVNIWRYGALYTVFALCRRCRIEDGQLHDRFGEEWEKYRQEVRYALVPLVY